MTPTTVSQILEVAVKVPIGLALAFLCVRTQKGLPIAAAGAIFGVMAGSAAALLYLVRYKRRSYRGALTGGECDSSREIFRDLLRIGIPITLGGCILSVINLVDNAQILNRLQNAAGFSAGDANILYGIYGKVQTLYMLPTYFVTPFQVSVVPAIAACVAKRQRREAGVIAESAMRTASVVVLPMCVGLAVLSHPIINVLWPGSSTAGPGILSLLAIASFFVCMTMLTNAVLQATGFERLPMISMVLGGLAKVIANHFLIADPAINVRGAALSCILCFAVMSGMNFFFLVKTMHRPPRISRFFLLPAVSAGVMGAAAWAVYGLASRVLSRGGELTRMPMLLAFAAAVCVAVVVYLVLIIALRAVTAKDLALIPKGDKLAALLHIR